MGGQWLLPQVMYASGFMVYIVYPETGNKDLTQ